MNRQPTICRLGTDEKDEKRLEKEDSTKKEDIRSCTLFSH